MRFDGDKDHVGPTDHLCVGVSYSNAQLLKASRSTVTDLNVLALRRINADSAQLIDIVQKHLDFSYLEDIPPYDNYHVAAKLFKRLNAVSAILAS